MEQQLMGAGNAVKSGAYHDGLFLEGTDSEPPRLTSYQRPGALTTPYMIVQLLEERPRTLEVSIKR